ncbi:hypothetical protein, partial [Nocardia sp. NPDC004722]
MTGRAVGTTRPVRAALPVAATSLAIPGLLTSRLPIPARLPVRTGLTALRHLTTGLPRTTLLTLTALRHLTTMLPRTALRTLTAVLTLTALLALTAGTVRTRTGVRTLLPGTGTRAVTGGTRLPGHGTAECLAPDDGRHLIIGGRTRRPHEPATHTFQPGRQGAAASGRIGGRLTRNPLARIAALLTGLRSLVAAVREQPRRRGAGDARLRGQPRDFLGRHALGQPTGAGGRARGTGLCTRTARRGGLLR